MKKIIVVIAAMVFSLTTLQIAQADETLRLKQYTETLANSKDNNELKQAFDSLSKFEPKTEQEIDFLVAAIAHADKNVSRAAQQALLNVKDSNLVPKVISVLENKDVKRSKGSQEDFNVKVAAIGVLGKLRDKRAVPVLVKNLDEGEFITGRASSALAEIGDESAIPELLSRIGQPNTPTGVALSEFGAPALKEIVKKIEVEKGKRKRINSKYSEDEYVIMTQIIGLIRDPKAVPQLEALLKNPDAEIRASAVQALGSMGKLNIAEAIHDEDATVRIRAVGAAKKTQDSSVNQILIDALTKDNSDEVKMVAASVLGDKKCHEAVPYLKEALNSENKQIKFAAKKALKKIGGN